MNHSSTSSSEDFRRFCRGVIVFLAPLILLGGVFHGYLYTLGENWTLSGVREVELSSSKETLFHRLIVPEEMRRYKMGNLVARKPRIATVGSSTTMQFRNFMFGQCADQFYNAGGMTHSVTQLGPLWEVLKTQPQLDVVIVGIDPWWFNPNWVEPPDYREFSKSQFKQDLVAAGLALKQLAMALRNPQHREAIQRAIDTPPNDKYTTIALGSRLGNGFRGSDGSRRYSIIEERAANNWVFEDGANVLERISKGVNRFEFADQVEPKRLEQLDSFLKNATEGGLVVAGFTPPLEPKVLKAVQESQNHREFWDAYLKSTSELFAKHGQPFVLAHDVEKWGFTDQNMIDGIHGSEVVILRVLQELGDNPRVSDALSNCDAGFSTLQHNAISPIELRK